jgi:hypothetical protein
VKIIKTKKEYEGRISYEVLSFGNKFVAWILSIVILVILYSFYALDVNYSDECMLGLDNFSSISLCSGILIADIIRILINILSAAIIFNGMKKYDIIADNNLQIFILRRKNIFNTIEDESKIFFEDIISVKFEYLREGGKKIL